MSEEIDKLRVLVVDDSRTLRAAINKILQAHFEILQAEDGEQAWDILMQESDISMVISDIMMPNLDGYGLICRIRAAEQIEIQELPILVITSSSDEITRERAHACGANDFVVKPVNPKDLVRRVRFHTEENLSDEDSDGFTTQEFQEIQTTIVETPDINEALEIIRGVKEGVISPYAIDLCIETLPLLEYCEENFSLGIADQIEYIREQLKKQAI